jgi:L,D-transpeptidase ErfK/SrfK
MSFHSSLLISSRALLDHKYSKTKKPVKAIEDVAIFMVSFIFMKTGTVVLAMLVIFFSPPSLIGAEVYSYGKDVTVIGSVETYKVKEHESLIEIARKFDLGFNEIADANPTLDPFVPGTGVAVVIPRSWILPDVQSYSGIVVNISEMRLYYFFEKGKSNVVRTFPIGIGDEGKDTPVGTFTVIQKIVNPVWHVPLSIQQERPELPKTVPPGPENPLGSHALRLSLGDVLIHGTNRPFAVGRRVTHGCIRLYPEDIPNLYSMVPNGMKVTIVRQPVKVGVKEKRVYIEVHKYENQEKVNYFNEAVRMLTKKGLLKGVSTEKIYWAVEEKSGIPVDISP